MIINTLVLIILILLNITAIIRYRKIISEKLNIIDFPDEKRKIHKTPTPLLGGLIIIINFTLIHFYLIPKNLLTLLDIQVLIFCFFSFLIGIIDDIKKISSINKLFFVGFGYISIGLFSDFFFIDLIYFETFSKTISLQALSIFFSVLCLLLLINALNLVDGINGLAILIAIVWLAYFFRYFDNINIIFILLLLTLLIILPFNLKSYFFLGDSGSILLGSIIAGIFITKYNQSSLSIIQRPVEEIFILFMIPGIDMFRLFLERILKKKNPFSSDRNHLHHYLIKNYSLNKSLLIYLFLIIMPILIYNFKVIPAYLIIFISIFLYVNLLLFLKKRATSYKSQEK